MTWNLADPEPLVGRDPACSGASRWLATPTAWVRRRLPMDGRPGQPRRCAETPQCRFCGNPLLPVYLAEQLLQRGIIAIPEGDRNEVLGLTPPLTITRRQLDYCIDVLVALLNQ